MRTSLLVCAFALGVACDKGSDSSGTDDSGQGDDSGASVDADKDGYDSTVDCDDTDATVNPGATEVCDEIDNDCVDGIDEGLTTPFYADTDGDTYGAGTAVDACAAPKGHVENADDCDDTNSDVNPVATEVCDTIDNNCAGGIDEGVTSADVEDVCGDDVDANCDGHVDNCNFDIDEAAFSLSGNTYGNSVGWSVGSGDVDGDGTDDLLVGAPNGERSKGAIYVVNGPASGGITVADVDATLAGSFRFEYLGSEVTAGDVDGDGYDDVLVAAVYSSSVSLFLGPVSSSTTASADLSFTSTVLYGSFGDAIALADLDGDAELDTAIAELYDSTYYGQVSIFMGPVSGAVSSADLIVTGSRMDGGSVVANVGDVDGDGLDDLAQGVPFPGGSSSEGEVFLLDPGSTTGTVTASSIAVATMTGENSADNFGYRIAGGDYNDDGYADLFTTAITADDGVMYWQGRVYGWLGPISGTFAGSSADVMVAGDTMYGSLGTDVELGDVSGDGAAEVVIGAGYTDTYRGKAYVLSGPTSGSFDLTSTATIGGADEATDYGGYMGYSVGTIGDWSGDSTDEVIVGGYGMAYDTTVGAGRTWVVSSDDL